MWGMSYSWKTGIDGFQISNKVRFTLKTTPPCRMSVPHEGRDIQDTSARIREGGFNNSIQMMKNLIACNIICEADRTPSLRIVLLNHTTDNVPLSSPVSQLSATPWIQISINFLLKQIKRPGNYALSSSVHKQDEATDQLEGIEDEVEDHLCLNIGKVSG